ncbi:type I secretion system permease/ATPase [Maritimibacter sp. 55A14]|uniref:type I secretion system permease/ATPase n=1 Tax=Maritimibacter sp. 55A14 TaxID=2174844 RepID=UPI000D6185CC|nr:type I secretion system permease/ATPase [Maritimibacter sp. 55A14]PWE32690.1 type I secretion system permease/ATPase [Maritimibacter sp. 55A14]
MTLWGNTRLFAAVFVFSVFVNLLMLTGPLYMLQVYDRVLASGSEETLAALSMLSGFLFLMMGLLDHARGRVMARAGARFQSRLDARVFAAEMDAAAPGARDRGRGGLRDLEDVQRLLTAPALTALFDLPWTPFFLAAIFLFHTWLGLLATAGTLGLILLAALNQWATAGPMGKSAAAGAAADRIAGRVAAEAETVTGLGMRGAAFARWSHARNDALARRIAASDRAGSFAVATRTLRLFLQSAILGLGALLVLRGEMSAGAMIASSVILGRALAPVEVTLGQWRLIQAARDGWTRLCALLSETPPAAPRTALSAPRARLEATGLTVVPPGGARPVLHGIGFRLEPGQALGVIGPSGSGKTALARAIAGVWQPASGCLRLDGAALDQYAPDDLGRHIGYLPQRVTLFDGTIAENIARLAPDPDPEKIVKAARKAAAHEMILHLPAGYDTPLSAQGAGLSGGEVQRIALARALFGDPAVLVLDEPNSSLDHDGSQALNAAIRAVKAAGGAVVIMAHRPAAIQECDRLLVLEGGAARTQGPRDAVLGRTVRNLHDLRGAWPAGAAGAS